MDTRAKGNDSEAFELHVKRILRGLCTSIPGIITSFNSETQTVKVKPAIRAIQTVDNVKTFKELPELIEVPVISFHAMSSGFSMTLPIDKGDECLLVFAQRSVDNWHDSGDIQNPVETITSRCHDLSDGFAMVGPSSKPNIITDYQTDCIELRNEDRSCRVSVYDKEIEIETPLGAYIKINQFGIIEIDSPTAVSVKAIAATVDIDFCYWNGTINHTGIINNTGSIISNGVVLNTHSHTGVESGNDISGPPVIGL